MNRFSSLRDLISALPQRADKPAIVALQKEGLDVWSYRKLSDHIARLAAGLAEAGLCRGERVAILAGNSPEWVVACLAVIQTGGVAVPLDVQLAANALNRLLERQRRALGLYYRRQFATAANRLERPAANADSARFRA